MKLEVVHADNVAFPMCNSGQLSHTFLYQLRKTQVPKLLLANRNLPAGSVSYEPLCEKTGLRGFDLVLHKPGCIVTEHS